MTTTKHNLLIAFALFAAVPLFGQQKRVWVSGAARGVMYGDNYSTDAETDSITIPKEQGGHAMVDLGVNINPNEQILIQGMVRVRNDYGGFWGSGVTFDVRQLYIKGVLGGFLGYQLGDINYKLTPYTLQNNKALINKYQGVITGVPLEQVQYDLFYYPDNTWRQQGGSIDFGLSAKKYVSDIDFNLFASRVRVSDFNNLDDRIYSGGSVVVTQSKYLKVGGQMVNLFDFKGTSNNTMYLRNPVRTLSAEGMYNINGINLNAALEAGNSVLEWEGDENAPVLEDYFYDFTLRAKMPKKGLLLSVGYRNVGPNFRSAGAQTMQINFARTGLAYNRYGNAQSLRELSMLDLYRDASLYRTQIQAGLAAYDPRYDNATPYGRATPNRKGLTIEAEYEDSKKRWFVDVDADLLSDVVGQGTTALKTYNTVTAMAELRLGNVLNWKTYKANISARYGMQNTGRTGTESYESIDLATNFAMINATFTLVGDLVAIAEYRLWQTNGFDLVAERDMYSVVNDYTETNIDYSESIVGAGLQYNFSDKTHLRFMWQNFTWEDNAMSSMNYGINSWTIFYTMTF